MNKAIATGLLSTFMFGLLVLPASAQNKVDVFGGQQIKTQVESSLGLGTKDVRVTIAAIINVFMGLLGIVAVVIILTGGFIWMTAGGDQEKTKKAKQYIISGIIGLIIILSSYAIATFVVNSIVNAV